jgi:uncharacterized membrane-anchored protein
MGGRPLVGRNLWVAIAAVALGQAAILGWIIWDRSSLLANGREVVLEVIPVDPRSLFRGDYVILGYDISRVELPAGVPMPKRNAPFYVTLKKGEGPYWKVANAGPQYPSGVGADEVVLKGRVDYVSAASGRGDGRDIVGVNYGIESFFVPEGTGRDLEKMVGDKKISAVIAVDGDGTAAIKGLLSEGQRVYEEPLI